jgi:ribokinase
MTKPIVIIGSINMDLICRTRAMPQRGETVMGEDFVTVPGGKGANQAVAAAKLARRSSVHMIGRVGADAFGEQLLQGLGDHRVRTEHVHATAGASTGVAMILVDRRGENSIVVAPGANARLTPADVDAAIDLIADAAVVVLQLEIPIETVRHAISLCRSKGVFTILDPAPVPPRFPEALFDVDCFTPNQTEAGVLLANGNGVHRRGRKRPPNGKQIASEFLSRGARDVVLKLGGRGAVWVGQDGQFQTAKAFPADVVDTTAAGDAFTGALAVARAEGMAVEQTLRFANAAGAICCSAFGAQPALPTRRAVERLLNGGPGQGLRR